jgi:acyl-[acyl-carrier-protein]-phospholipid O-acyltransferase/long-chain-fatty-acid--[acyl-carrier-protein] ligase
MWQLIRRERSFRALISTQFLGAFNDNAFKQLVLLMIVGGSVSWVREHPMAVAYGQALPSALFSLPFVLFGALTGSLADRVSKVMVIRGANLMEVAIMVGALGAFLSQSYVLLLVCVLLMGLQSAIFGPSKYGVIPELINEKDISRGNALIQVTTFLAIILGVVVGGQLLESFGDNLVVPGGAYVLFAALGYVISLRIKRTPAQDPSRPLNWNLFAELRNHWRAVSGDKVLVLSVWASSLFYLVAACLMLVVNAYGSWLGLSDGGIALSNAMIALGIVIGSVLAGKISGDRIETGLIPLGLGGIATSLFAMQASPENVTFFRCCLVSIGIFSGLFSIPIRGLLQTRPHESSRGAVLGLSETVDFTGILMASGVYYLFEKVLDLSPPEMCMVLATLVLLFLCGSLFYTAQFAIRLGLLLLVRCLYRVRVEGHEHVPAEGGALLVCNHVSLVDGMLVAASLPREPRFLMYTPFFKVPVLGWFAKRMGVIPVSSGDSPEEKRDSLKAASAAAAGGDLVCIFAEGAVTRSGAMLGFARGLERIAGEAGVPIVPIALDRLWGSLFSFESGKVLFKRPQRIPYPVDMLIGEALPHDSAAWEVRNAVAERLAIHQSARAGPWGHLGRRLLLSAKEAGRRAALVTVDGIWSHRRLLTEALATRTRLEAVLPRGERVAIALPLGRDAVTISLALCLSQRVSVLLDSEGDLEENIQRLARSGAVAVIAEAELGAALGKPVVAPGLVAPRSGGRLKAWLSTWLPTSLLARSLRLGEDSSRCAVIHFDTSADGSEVMIPLSHANVLSNVQGLAAMVDLSPGDRILAALPLHGAFGRTTTLFAPLLSGAAVALAAERRDAAAVVDFVKETGVTHLVGTASKCREWLEEGSREHFEALKLSFVGGEETPDDELILSWRERFGSELLVGHGRTECGPVISLNVPDVDLMGTKEEANRVGTVGRALPGTALRVVDASSGEALSPGTPGVLLVKGPGVTSGYLDDEELTDQKFGEGWFRTDELAVIDKHGFVKDIPFETKA